MPTILGANTLSTGYDVANSLTLDDDSSAFLSKTFSGDGTHHDKGTVSVWLKRAELGAEQGIFTAGSSNRHFIRFESGGNLTFRATTDSFHVQTTQVFRDPSAWYHIVIAYDTSQGTASNRVKMYVNGSQVSSFSQTDYPDQDLDIKLGAAELNCIGKDSEQTNPYFDGYMCEFAYIDGTQLAASSFGEFDEDSPAIWKPKKFVNDVTFGTNGFYMEFKQTGTSANSSGIGADTSGNDNHFAVSGLAATDQGVDTCTNNFATLNPLYNFYVDPTLAEGNTKVSHNAAWAGAKATMGVSTGKWYWEVKLSGTMADHHHGVQQENVDEGAQNPQNTTGTTVFFNGDGGEMKTDSTATTADYGTFSDGDIMGLALDMDAGSYGQLTIFKNGSAIVSDFNLAASSTTVMPFASIGNSTAEYNFGNPAYANSSGVTDGKYGDFEYAPPSGHYALCTKRLSEFG
jgi:hypothetical protein